jgi:hypothetical protein
LHARNGDDGLAALRTLVVDVVVLVLTSSATNTRSFLERRSADERLSKIPLLAIVSANDRDGETDRRIQRVLRLPFAGSVLAASLSELVKRQLPT